MDEYIKLWIDDVRAAPDDTWIIARSAEAALTVLKMGIVGIVSFDHDLGEEIDGADLLQSLVEMVDAGKVPSPFVVGVHTANPYERMMMLKTAQARLPGARCVNGVPE